MSCWDTFVEVVPVVVVLFLYFWSYYVYIVEMCWKMVKSLAKQIIYGIILNILFSMVMWCYFATMCTDHDSVPPYYKPPFRLREEIRLAESEEQRNDIIVSYLSSRNINVQTTNVRGYIRSIFFIE